MHAAVFARHCTALTESFPAVDAERAQQQQKLEELQSESAAFQRRAEASDIALATVQVSV